MQDFIKISKYAGMRNDLAQAGGGNTSVKLDDHIMLVKSSGFQLADVSEQAGYSRVDLRQERSGHVPHWYSGIWQV